MSLSLEDALQQVDLEAGRTYQCRVGKLHVQVRVEENVPNLLPAPLDESDIMLDPWTDFPSPPGGTLLKVTRVVQLLPDVPEIPVDWEESCFNRESGGDTMTVEGVVVNGVIVLEGGAQLSEGSRVRIEVIDPDDFGPPPEPYDREKELAILREALEDVQSGRGMPARDFLKQLAMEYNFPLEAEEETMDFTVVNVLPVVLQ